MRGRRHIGGRKVLIVVVVIAVVVLGGLLGSSMGGLMGVNVGFDERGEVARGVPIRKGRRVLVVECGHAVPQRAFLESRHGEVLRGGNVEPEGI